MLYVISSRVRIARNLAGYPFPPEAAGDDRAAVVARVRQASEPQAWFPTIAYLVMDELHPLDRRILEEKRLVSVEFVRPQSHRVALLARTREFSILVNEEDHLRIQALRPGFEVFSAWQQACALERSLGISLDFASSESSGYATTCSSNSGSGIRASVMLFLPALIGMQRTSQEILRHMHAVGYTVRGLYGEGSQSIGSQIQISCHITALRSGEQRQEIQRLYAACNRLITEERRARRQILASHGRTWIDKQIEQIQQTVNTAEKIGFRAGMAMLSKLRLALALREAPHAFDSNARLNEQLVRLDRLMMRIQPAHIRQYAGSSGRQHIFDDIARAEILKQALHVQV